MQGSPVCPNSNCEDHVWNSWQRKLQDPFVYNKTTIAAAIATKANSARRGGWRPFIGLRGGCEGEMEVSKCAIHGRYKGGETEIQISYHNEELTIVRRSKGDRIIVVNRTKIVQDTRVSSSGETVEKGENSEEEVFKKFTLCGGPGENHIEVEEFRIEKPELRPQHASKLVNVTLYKFMNDNGTEKLKVMVVGIGLFRKNLKRFRSRCSLLALQV